MCWPKWGGLDIAGLAECSLEERRTVSGGHGRIYFLRGGAGGTEDLSPASDYMIASHVSKEPAAELILKALGKEAVIHGDMCLGEGSGAWRCSPSLTWGSPSMNP